MAEPAETVELKELKESSQSPKPTQSPKPIPQEKTQQKDSIKTKPTSPVTLEDFQIQAVLGKGYETDN